MSCELETVWESTETNLSPYIHSDTETALLGQSLSSEILNVERVSCDQDQDTRTVTCDFCDQDDGSQEYSELLRSNIIHSRITVAH